MSKELTTALNFLANMKPPAPDTPTPAPQTETALAKKLRKLASYLHDHDSWEHGDLVDQAIDALREAREERDSANGTAVRWHDQYWKAIEERDAARRNDLYTTKASYDLMKSRAEARCAALEAEILREREARKQAEDALRTIIHETSTMDHPAWQTANAYFAATSQPPSQPTGGGA